MASATPLHPSTKETSNYARLCHLLVDVGSCVLREIFDRICPPGNLHTVLSDPKNHAKLQTLRKKRVLSTSQWHKLYPAFKSSVCSRDFDTFLLVFLLRNIWGLTLLASGQDDLPLATDTSPAADITRIKILRDRVYSHVTSGSVDDPTFSSYWNDIRDTFQCIGGARYRDVINDLEIDCMDADSEKYYQELFKEWLKDEDCITDKSHEDEMVKKARREDDLENSLRDLRDTTDKTEIEMKEVKETLCSLTTTVEKKAQMKKMIGEMVKMDSELKEVKEKLCTLTASVGESKDEGKLNYTIKVILLNRKFRRSIFDPTELINGIRQLYKTREGWLSPFPWCEEFQFFLGNIFTRLKVVRRKKTRGVITDVFVDMSSILDPYEECSAPRTVLIEGEPGMGKTTYCKKYAYDWATKQQKPQGCGSTAFKVVLLLKCRDIHSDVWEAIDDQLLSLDIDEKVKRQFFQFIRENQSSILLILDGLDELPSGKLSMFSKLIEGKALPRCHIVATARHEAGKEVRKCCDALLQIEGFTKEHVIKFVIKYFRERRVLAIKLLLRMGQDENLREIAANPLNTALLCLLCEEFEGTLPESRAQLYLDMVECVLRRYRKRKGLLEKIEDLTNHYKPQLNHLGKVALNGLLDDKLDFNESELRNHAKDLTEFGFLSVQPGGSKLRQTLHYAFLHKSFQEFFLQHSSFLLRFKARR
ncbi:unnamed protein product [Pocillopora meandrina]|uniref:NACHT domain-containing protein n=1 Tax=Pocillopora meandrina TaxID=46732 RepID=A0AAU9Y120_9CNID|nr:unnamed protein product [Pocillopora meandrina]